MRAMILTDGFWNFFRKTVMALCKLTDRGFFPRRAISSWIWKKSLKQAMILLLHQKRVHKHWPKNHYSSMLFRRSACSEGQVHAARKCTLPHTRKSIAIGPSIFQHLHESSVFKA